MGKDDFEIDFFDLFVVDTGKSWKASRNADMSQSFWLPKEPHTQFGERNENGSYIIGIPKWLQLKHRQLCGDQEFDNQKKDKR